MASSRHRDPRIGQTFDGRYRIEALLGRGGMSAVYRARHLAMDQPIAVKVLAAHLSEDPRQVQRFHQEALASSRLQHPNTIQIFDHGQTADGALYLAMEYLDGEPLSARLEREGALRDVGVVARIGRQIAKSVGEAHQHDLVHRDLKPENVFVCDVPGERDFVKVLDFGVAKFAASSTGKAGGSGDTDSLCGTPHYGAPEQARGEEVDGRSDLYALGVILYRMLSGRLPFDGDSGVGIAMKHVEEEPPELRAPEGSPPIPEELRGLVRRLMAKSPSERPASALEVAEILESVERQPPTRPGVSRTGRRREPGRGSRRGARASSSGRVRRPRPNPDPSASSTGRSGATGDSSHGRRDPGRAKGAKRRIRRGRRRGRRSRLRVAGLIAIGVGAALAVLGFWAASAAAPSPSAHAPSDAAQPEVELPRASCPGRALEPSGACRLGPARRTPRPELPVGEREAVSRCIMPASFMCSKGRWSTAVRCDENPDGA